MASAGHLQLFPPPPGSQHQPAKLRRKQSRRKTPQPVSPINEDSAVISPTSVYSRASKGPGQTEEIVIHISPSTKRTVQRAQGRSPSPAVQVPERAATASPPVPHSGMQHQYVQNAASQPIQLPDRARTASPSAMSTSSTLVRSPSQSSEVQPIRSMFPQYDPSRPLAQNPYQSPPAQAGPSRDFKRDDTSTPTIMYAKPLRNLRDTGKTLSPASAGSASFPATFQNMPPPQYSTPTELEELWDAANGQDVSEKGRTYALQMNKDGIMDLSSKSLVPAESESYTFCSSRKTPFYDLQTQNEDPNSTSFSEVLIRRHDPISRTAIPIMYTTLQSPQRQLPPADGLIAEIYPKTAAMMALELASDLPEEEAGRSMQQAMEKECCRLLWNQDKQKYHLYHPSIPNSKGKGTSFVLHFEGGTAGFDAQEAKGTVRLVNVESGDTLVALEFGTATLLVNTGSTSKVPSLYIVDVAVTAVLLTAIVEGRRVRANTFAPPPTAAMAAKKPSKEELKRIEKARQGSPKQASPKQGSPRTGSPRQKIQDEEMGFQPPMAAQQDEKLPKGAKGSLSILYGTYKAVVWLLGAIVHAIAAVIVAIAGACGKSRS
ncbi:MAG: hypothetical protein M1814_004940 [Vezdaea aestivalis]|nr:MAG: hypothetical protein M1814_004940 [Vezdaea aestivalis]